MKTYKEYYSKAASHERKWYLGQTEEWWRKYEEEPTGEYSHDSLNILGDYLETVRIKSKHERNDSSIITNHTNVNNSKWDILFDILGQALIDWLIENGETNIYSFGFSMNRIVDGLENFYTLEKRVKVLDTEYSWKEVENPNPKFDECAQVLCDIVDRFITEQGNDIPCDWNYFGFGLDELMHSCEYGEWCPCSDGSMSLYNKTQDEWTEYMECL